MKPEQIILLLGFAAFAWYEFGQASPALATVPNNPANANALGVPTAGINASTLSPMQLGSGLFENESGLQTSPGVS